MPALETSWPAATIPPSCSLDEVHVWAVALNVPPEKNATLAATLSLEERERAKKFHYDQHRNRFIVGRGVLRVLLAGYLQGEPRKPGVAISSGGSTISDVPARLEFAYGSQGKPRLANPQSGIHFNLAHSNDLALIAITRLGEVGVDVELVRPMPDAERIAERFFSAGEAASIRTVPAVSRDAAFFSLWTRKEAWLKATGDGISESLAKVEVTFLPNEIPRVLAIAADAVAAAEWSLLPLFPPAGFVGALAIHHREVRLKCWRFES